MRPVAEALGVRPGRIRVLEDPPAAARSGRRRPPTAAARPTCWCPAPSPPTSRSRRCSRPRGSPPEIALPHHRQPAQGRGAAASPPTRPATCASPTTCRSPSSSALLAGAAVVLGLTDREGIQLSVANEALGARSRAGAVGHPHPAGDVRRGRALRRQHPREPGGGAARGARPPRRAPRRQRGAPGPPAGALARRGRARGGGGGLSRGAGARIGAGRGAAGGKCSARGTSGRRRGISGLSTPAGPASWRRPGHPPGRDRQRGP